MYVLLSFLASLMFSSLSGSIHSGPPEWRRSYETVDAFALKFAKNNHLQFLSTGLNGHCDGKRTTWDLSFTSDQTLTLEEARLLTARLSYELLHMAYHNPIFSECCGKSAIIKNPKVEEQYFGFRIAFWDQNVDRPLYPHIAQIRLADKFLYFHYADPETQALQEPIVEPLSSLDLPNYQ